MRGGMAAGIQQKESDRKHKGEENGDRKKRPFNSRKSAKDADLR
jgi:hypothetical protein